MFNLVYDIGANRGQNLEYYLSKGQRVVAIEPQIDLCNDIEINFRNEVKNKNLIICNKAIVIDENLKKVKLYIDKNKNWKSSLLQEDIEDYVIVKSIVLKKLFEAYGTPDCIKIDVEGYDLEVLKYLKVNGYKPKYLVVEIQNKEIFNYLLDNFSYKYFNFVIGYRVSKDYKTLNLKTHSSGPLLNDLKFNWVNKKLIKVYFKLIRLGWVDIHCTNLVLPKGNSNGLIFTFFYLLIDLILRNIIPIKNKLAGKIKSIIY